MVDNKSTVSNLVKLHHLRNCPTGPAVNLLQTTDLAGDGYLGVLVSLKSRFQNKQYLANTHLKSIFQFKAITSESSQAKKKTTLTTKSELTSSVWDLKWSDTVETLDYRDLGNTSHLPRHSPLFLQ
jgi:hypothetical protein